MRYSSLKKISIGLLFIILIGLLIFATQSDLSINQALYSPQNGFAIFMEAVGWWPLYIPSLVWGGLLLRRNHKPFYGFLIALGSATALWIPTFHYFEYRGWFVAFPWWPKAILICITFLASIWFAGIPGRRTSMRLRLLCCAGFWLMIANNVLLQSIKLVWNRTRFDDMVALGNFDKFSVWYLPFGNGGSSFPSAHTAAAASVLLILLAADIFPFVRRNMLWFSLLCCGYIGTMMLSRVIIGRHFLSDTIIATLLVFCMFLYVKYSALWKFALKRLQDKLTSL